MSSNTAELTLLIKARNLVDVEMAKVKTSLNKLTVTAKQVATDMSDAFKRVGSRIGNQLGNLAQDILQGGNLTTSLVALGATLAGAAVEGLSAHFIPMILTRVMSTAAFAPLAAAMAAGGATLGSVMATAIAVGAAAFPFILLALAVAALIYVATNPEFRAKIKAVALEILGRIGDALRKLAALLAERFRAGVEAARQIVADKIRAVIKFFTDIPDKIREIVSGIPAKFAAAWRVVVRGVTNFVGRIVDKLRSIIAVIKDVIAWLLELGRHMPGIGGQLANLAPHAAGGWVGLHGPEIGLLGEKGPEYIVPNDQLGRMGGGGSGGAGFRIQGISEREIIEMVDRGLYFKLQRAAPTRMGS